MIKGRARLPMSRCGRPHESGIVRKFCFFDGHVFEFAGFEDFTALQAFDEFFVFLAGHDLHTRVLALCHVTSLLGELGRRGWSHKSGCWISLFRAVRGISPEFGGILDRLIRLSSPSLDLSVEGARSKLDFIYCRNAGTEITRHKRLRASR